jgi:hypothetical protein
MVGVDEISAFGRHFGAPLALVLELLRTSRLRSTKQRDGWTAIDQERLEPIDLTDRRFRHRVVQYLADCGMIEVRSRPGCKLEYRLKPDWAKPRAEVVDLATVRKRRWRVRARTRT